MTGLVAEPLVKQEVEVVGKAERRRFTAAYRLGEGFQEPRDAHEIQYPLEVVRQHGEAELPAHLAEGLEQEIPLVHAALHRAEGVFGEGLALAEAVGRTPQALPWLPADVRPPTE